MSEFNFSPDLALELFNSTEEFPVDFDIAWQWLDYSNKSNAKRAFMSCNFLKGIDYGIFIIKEDNLSAGRPTEKILLTVDCLKCWAMMSNTDKGLLVRRYFLECEKTAKQVVNPHEFTAEFVEKIAIAVIERLEKAIIYPKRDAKSSLEVLDKCANGQYLLSTSQVQQIVGIKPQRAGIVSGPFTIIRQGKIGRESSWLVTRTKK